MRQALPIFIELVKTLPNIIVLYILTILFSIPLGILGALAYTGKNKIIKFFISVYTWIFRGTPLMLQLMVVYYGIPLMKIGGYKIVLEPYTAATITLIKDTSLIYVLAVTEVMKRTKELANIYYNITPYICAIIIYLVLSFAIDRLFKNIEKRNKVRI